MGEELAGKLELPTPENRRSAEPPKPPVPRSGGTESGRAAGNPRPADARTRTDSARSGGDSRTPEKEKVSGLAPVIEKPTKKESVPVPETPKKKQTRKPRKKKEEPVSFNAEQISSLILSTSTIIAARPDMAIWMLNEQESMQLATPIANMIQKSEALQKMGEYADAVALVTAALVIFGPRAYMYHDQQKKKKMEKGVIKNNVRKEQKSTGSSAKPDRPSTSSGPSVPPSIFEQLPATVY